MTSIETERSVEEIIKMYILRQKRIHKYAGLFTPGAMSIALAAIEQRNKRTLDAVCAQFNLPEVAVVRIVEAVFEEFITAASANPTLRTRLEIACAYVTKKHTAQQLRDTHNLDTVQKWRTALDAACDIITKKMKRAVEMINEWRDGRCVDTTKCLASLCTKESKRRGKAMAVALFKYDMRDLDAIAALCSFTLDVPKFEDDYDAGYYNMCMGANVFDACTACPVRALFDTAMLEADMHLPCASALAGGGQYIKMAQWNSNYTLNAHIQHRFDTDERIMGCVVNFTPEHMVTFVNTLLEMRNTDVNPPHNPTHYIDIALCAAFRDEIERKWTWLPAEAFNEPTDPAKFINFMKQMECKMEQVARLAYCGEVPTTDMLREHFFKSADPTYCRQANNLHFPVAVEVFHVVRKLLSKRGRGALIKADSSFVRRADVQRLPVARVLRAQPRCKEEAVWTHVPTPFPLNEDRHVLRAAVVDCLLAQLNATETRFMVHAMQYVRDGDDASWQFACPAIFAAVEHAYVLDVQRQLVGEGDAAPRVDVTRLRLHGADVCWSPPASTALAGTRWSSEWRRTKMEYGIHRAHDINYYQCNESRFVAFIDHTARTDQFLFCEAVGNATRLAKLRSAPGYKTPPAAATTIAYRVYEEWVRATEEHVRGERIASRERGIYELSDDGRKVYDETCEMFVENEVREAYGRYGLEMPFNDLEVQNQLLMERFCDHRALPLYVPNMINEGAAAWRYTLEEWSDALCLSDDVKRLVYACLIGDGTCLNNANCCAACCKTLSDEPSVWRGLCNACYVMGEFNRSLHALGEMDLLPEPLRTQGGRHVHSEENPVLQTLGHVRFNAELVSAINLNLLDYGFCVNYEFAYPPMHVYTLLYAECVRRGKVQCDLRAQAHEDDVCRHLLVKGADPEYHTDEYHAGHLSPDTDPYNVQWTKAEEERGWKAVEAHGVFAPQMVLLSVRPKMRMACAYHAYTLQ